jgi:tetratricopeptide (TPR) repeat protein
MMETPRFRISLFAVLAGGLALFSCAPSKGPALSPDTSQARRYFLVGDYEGAISAYAALAEHYRSVVNEYAEIIENIKAKADRAFDSADYSAAENMYSVLLKNYSLFEAFERPLSFGPPRLSQRILECQILLSERRARQSLAAGDYQKALDSYRSLPAEVLRESGVSAGLRRIMEELKRLADVAIARKDFRAAGKGYAALLNDAALTEQAGLSLSFSGHALEEGLKKCRTELTKEGLDQYRKGRLKEAIAIWRDLLEFDSDNVEIRKAVETATEQLEKLKKG